MIKRYTEAELKQRISKKYHHMIDWKATFFCGFDGSIALIEGYATSTLYPSLYERISSVNWYLREIEKDPNAEW